jgi:hypothetical protein
MFMNEIIHDYVGGSKQHLTSQCVYIVFKNIILLGPFAQKQIIIFFFKWNILKLIIYYIYSCPNVSYGF